MDFSEYLSVWDKLTPQQQASLTQATSLRTVPKGTLLYNSLNECMGFLLIRSGQLRAFISSDEGREITICRLFERDICLFSATCILKSMQFEVSIEAEKDTEFWVIPPTTYSTIMEQSAPLANYTNQIISSKFSEVMWLIEQIMWKSFDKRLASFLIEESAIEGSLKLHITHEKIANHLGTAREVVTRMLKYFQTEDMVKLTRGAIEIIDFKKLQKLG